MRFLTSLLVIGAVALALSGPVLAGYGTFPNGHSFEVTVGSAGYIATPQHIDFVVYLDSQDSFPYVWVSSSSTVGAYNLPPSGTSVGSCGPYNLIPFGEPGKWVCRVSTILMRPGQTYYWWLDFDRREANELFSSPRLSGPFPFSVVERASPPPTTTPPTTPPESDETVSTAAADDAGRLPARERFEGYASIKHSRLTRLVYQTMRALGVPRNLAFFCWTRDDWASVLLYEGGSPDDAHTRTWGFWLGRYPRWLHLAPMTCTEVQGLLDSKRVNSRRAFALTTVIHETMHAYGIMSEAKANCFAVQLTPIFGLRMGLTVRRARYLGTLAVSTTRRGAPPGYWNGYRCRDGGAWDLFPGARNLG
jgi:hypothetical protein